MFFKRIYGLLKARFKLYLKKNSKTQDVKEYNGGRFKKHFKKE